MKINLIKENKSIYSYEFKDSEKFLEEFIDAKNYSYIEIELTRNIDKLRLLVILSPIFHSFFDNGNVNTYSSFLANLSEKSKYPFALFPNFFDFNYEDYLKDANNDFLYEDITMDDTIKFKVNPMDKKYLLSLLILIDSLIEDDSERFILLRYFSNMKDSTVINGRRSVLANGIRGFYLSKYIAVWVVELIKISRIRNPENHKYLIDISNLINDLKPINKA
ncbi:MAG: hypothetical protein Q4B36_06015 [Tissierellia bacterium]|nr:hypothetical protein [Tissierellia bacterium]